MPQNTKNAVCKDDTGAAVNVTNIGTDGLGFTANATGGKIVTCTVYNQAPNPQVQLRVDKNWVINQTPYANNAQPFGSAALKLSVNGGAPQNAVFGTLYTYNVGDVITITEDVAGLPTFCSNVGSGTGAHTMTLTPNPNVVTVTNTVTCTTQLRLSKKVEGGTASSSLWNLVATGPGGSATGPSGKTPTTFANVTAGAKYVLAESGGDPRYAQEIVPGAVLEPGATGSWHCYNLNANGSRGSEVGGLNGYIQVGVGQHIDCEAVNRTATLILQKHVVNDNGGSATANAWDLTADPSTTPSGSCR